MKTFPGRKDRQRQNPLHKSLCLRTLSEFSKKGCIVEDAAGDADGKTHNVYHGISSVTGKVSESGFQVTSEHGGPPFLLAYSLLAGVLI